eukprot:9522568-Lingulodinium_polyedra.AAC.1
MEESMRNGGTPAGTIVEGGTEEAGRRRGLAIGDFFARRRRFIGWWHQGLYSRRDSLVLK